MSKNKAWAILWGVLFLIGFLLMISKKSEDPKIEIKEKTIKGDSAPTKKDLPKPVAQKVYVDTSQVKALRIALENALRRSPQDTLWRPVDTSAIFALFLDYFRHKIYQDTLKNDSSALIVVRDTVFMNELLRRVLLFENRRATKIIMPFEKCPEAVNKFFVGMAIGRKTNEFGFGPALLLMMKTEKAYGLTYDALNKCVYLQLYWKLGFRRKVP